MKIKQIVFLPNKVTIKIIQYILCDYSLIDKKF